MQLFKCSFFQAITEHKLYLEIKETLWHFVIILCLLRARTALCSQPIQSFICLLSNLWTQYF